MNMNFCRFVCGECEIPNCIIHNKDTCKWFIIMNYYNDKSNCRLQEIEDASELFSNPPNGWIFFSEPRLSNKEILYFGQGNPEEAMRNVKLKENCECKYIVEQTLYDFYHSNKMKQWKNKLARKFKPNKSGGENAKADGKELP